MTWTEDWSLTGTSSRSVRTVGLGLTLLDVAVRGHTLVLEVLIFQVFGQSLDLEEVI